MTGRNTTWAAYGLAGAVLLGAGFWSGATMPHHAVVPQTETGIVVQVSGNAGAFVFQPSGTRQRVGYPLPGTVLWRDPYGNWHDGSRAACMQPLSHGQHISFGLVRTASAGDAPGGDLVAWLECARKPVPVYPVVPPASRTPAG